MTVLHLQRTALNHHAQSLQHGFLFEVLEFQILVIRVLRECDGLLSEVWINTVQHSEELICNIFRRPKGAEGIAIQFAWYFL